MKQVIRQVFGTTRPRDIWMDLVTFDRLISKPIVHIIYWCGLGLLVIAAFGTLGVAIGSAMKDGSVMGWILALPMLVIGWLSILICILIWRAACEFFFAVMSIAEDLRVLRQYQEKLEKPAPPAVQPAVAPVMQTAAAAQPRYQSAAAQAEYDVATPDAQDEIQPVTQAQPNPGDILEDPFFRPRFERRDV